jgi:hypothetical protein
MLRRALHADSAARLRCSDRTATQTGSGCAEGAVTGSEAGGPNIRIVTIAGTQVAPHLPSRPRHTRCRCGCARRGRTLGRRRARHPSRQSFGTTRRIRLENLSAGSHLGSTLKPGGAVLTLGVFRRSRSVAYIRADASPSEVLASAMVPPNSEGVNLARGHESGKRPLAECGCSLRSVAAVQES